ncbi:MAG: Gfo/Idh/MocA family oxidoreductase [Kiritimatiellae bacterium]|nr:Gfo/Idh/MocA family oxidoreductase [Kiritimatiellia bacterium]
MTQTARFAIIGGGWRAAFYLRVARALPERFACCGMTVRDGGKGEPITRQWGVKTYRTAEAMLDACSPCFVVVSVPWQVAPEMLRVLAAAGVPTLCETPPAPDREGLARLSELVRDGARIQVAEQYVFQPMHAARLAVIRSGRLGTVTQAQVSAAHGYHGISLIRHYLGAGFEDLSVTARKFVSPIVTGPTRDGPPAEEKLAESVQTLAWLDFGGKLGVFDFAGDQYFSWIRSPHVLIRGERGEIRNAELRWLKAFDRPVQARLERREAGQDGNLEGYYLKGIALGEEWVYENPFAPARLTDDELAVATCLAKMAAYVDGGPEFYSLAEAAQDHYISLTMGEAVRSGASVSTATQPWAV